MERTEMASLRRARRGTLPQAAVLILSRHATHMPQQLFIAGSALQLSFNFSAHQYSGQRCHLVSFVDGCTPLPLIFGQD